MPTFPGWLRPVGVLGLLGGLVGIILAITQHSVVFFVIAGVGLLCWSSSILAAMVIWARYNRTRS